MLAKELKQQISTLSDDSEVSFSVAIDTSIDDGERWFADGIHDMFGDNNKDVTICLVAESNLGKDSGLFDINTAGVAGIVAMANKLARRFYADEGYIVPEDYKFYEATHPHEQACWSKAVIVFEEMFCTEMSDVLLELDE